MTYLQFHLLFIVPPLLLLIGARMQVDRTSAGARSTAAVIWGMAGIALFYTTPWDNYLVWKRVWTYGTDRVLGTIGYVPVEEYLFFILQALLTGYWFDLVHRSGSRRWAFRRPAADAPRSGPSVAGTGVWLLLTVLGIWFLSDDHTLYLGCILAWAAPVGVLQWFLKGDAFWHRRKLVVLAVAIPTLYLWMMDRVAIGLKIWSISPAYTTGWHLFGLPIEEAVFFLVTNLMVVQGILMFVDPECARRSSDETRRQPRTK